MKWKSPFPTPNKRTNWMLPMKTLEQLEKRIKDLEKEVGRLEHCLEQIVSMPWDSDYGSAGEAVNQMLPDCEPCPTCGCEDPGFCTTPSPNDFEGCPACGSETICCACEDDHVTPFRCAACDNGAGYCHCGSNWSN